MVQPPVVNEEKLSFTRGFSDEVKRAREALGLTQTELAAELGTSQTEISFVERYKIQSTKLVRPLCRFLGLPLPLPPTDDPLVQRLYIAGRLLSDHPDLLSVLVDTAERFFELARSRKPPP